MSLQLDEYKVRFGDLSYGPLMHWSVYYNLAIRGIEELSYKIDHPIEELVEAGRVPYAPVAVDADIERYPGYESTIQTSGRTIYVGEKSFGVEYTFREAEAEELATVNVTHVTLATDGEAEPIQESARERLHELRTAPAGNVRRPPSDLAVEGKDRSFVTDVVFRTPMIEAVDLGYFTDYFRLMSTGLEEYLAERGISVRLGNDDRYPFFATGGQFAFVEPINFEDRITIRGAVADVSPDNVTVNYEFAGEDKADVRIRGRLHVGCFDDEGECVRFPRDVLERLPGPPS